MLNLKRLKIPIDLDLEEHSLIEEAKYGWDITNAGYPGDATILEYYLIREGYVYKPGSWRHDFCYQDMKIDCKELVTKYFNIQRGKTEQYTESIVKGQLSHFLFWKSDRPRHRRLKVGDTLNIDIIGLVDARKTLKLRVPSFYDDTEAYVRLSAIDIIKQNLVWE